MDDRRKKTARRHTPIDGCGVGPSRVVCPLTSAGMARDTAAPSAYKSIADDYLECNMTLRHSFPSLLRQHPQKVNFAIEGTREVLELVEYVGTCTLCGTVRTMYRDRFDGSFVWATYSYPDGYLAPPGSKWDRAAMRQEFRRRHPIGGQAKTLTRKR